MPAMLCQIRVGYQGYAVVKGMVEGVGPGARQNQGGADRRTGDGGSLLGLVSIVELSLVVARLLRVEFTREPSDHRPTSVGVSRCWVCVDRESLIDHEGTAIDFFMAVAHVWRHPRVAHLTSRLLHVYDKCIEG